MTNRGSGRGVALAGGGLLAILMGVAGAAEAPCVGDCDSSGSVAINEVVNSVNIFLENALVSSCGNADQDGDGKVLINEVVAAVNSFLDAATCPTVQAPPGIPERVAAGAAVVSNGMGIVPSVVTAIASGFEFSGGQGAGASMADGGSAASACPLGGSATREGQFPFGTLTITLQQCEVPTAQGSVRLSGTVVVSGFFTVNVTVDIEAVFLDAQQATVLTASADLTGTVTGIHLADACFLDAATLTLTGTMQAQAASGGGVTVQFTNTTVAVAITAFSGDCVPEIYTLTFNGPATLTETSTGESFDVVFSDFAVAQNSTTSPALTSLDGDIDSTCFGGTVTLNTVTDLTTVVGELCPTGGSLTATPAGGQPAGIAYLPDGSVEIDTDLDDTPDEVFSSCLAPALLGCP